MNKSTQTVTGEGNAPRSPFGTSDLINEPMTDAERQFNNNAILKRQLGKVEAQRDELLAALAGIVALARDPAGSTIKLREMLNEIEGKAALAAIAKAEGASN